MGTPLGSIPRTDPKGTVWEYSGEHEVFVLTIFCKYKYFFTTSDKELLGTVQR